MTRETSVLWQGRPLLVRLEAGGKLVRVRQKGLRTWHTLPIQALFVAAVRCTVEELRRIKREKREERRRLKLAR